MFQFTTTNVINSTADLYGKTIENGLILKKIGTFKKDNVENGIIYKRAASDPVNEIVTIDLSGVTGLTEGDSLRLSIYIGLSQGSADSRYANDLAYKGMPFSVDFVYDGTMSTTLATLIKTINKYELLVCGEKIINASVSGTTLTLTATNEYQRFKKVVVEKFVKDATTYPYGGEYKVLASGKVSTHGKEGFGTYSYLLHNLRIPTSARTNAFAINQDEAPIIGAKYDQYTLHYCVNRGPLGLNAVGDTVKSVTTHVFYVLSTLSDAFKTKLGTIGTVTDYPTSESSATVGE